MPRKEDKWIGIKFKVIITDGLSKLKDEKFE
jgi:hypothetical protein